MKTKLQIYRSAEQAAEDSLAAKNKHEADTFALDRFESEQLDARDYEFWVGIYNASRQSFAQLATQKSFSAIQTQA